MPRRARLLSDVPDVYQHQRLADSATHGVSHVIVFGRTVAVRWSTCGRDSNVATSHEDVAVAPGIRISDHATTSPFGGTEWVLVVRYERLEDSDCRRWLACDNRARVPARPCVGKHQRIPVDRSEIVYTREVRLADDCSAIKICPDDTRM